MNTPRPKGRPEEVALFRSEVVGALTRRFSVPTLQRWYYAYRRGGLAALRPGRKRRGQALALTDEQRALLADIHREYPQAAAELVLRTLVADGRLRRRFPVGSVRKSPHPE